MPSTGTPSVAADDQQRPAQSDSGNVHHRNHHQLLRGSHNYSFSHRFTSTETLSAYANSDGSTPTLQSRTDLALVAQSIARKGHTESPHNTCNCIARCLAQARENGGDADQRLQQATRTAVGSIIHFSLLVFTQQDSIYLGAVWIGNIFYHVCLGNDLGSSLKISRGFAKSVLLTTAASLPIAHIVKLLATEGHSASSKILLPFLTFLGSFAIMSCPWLTYRNLMILVMYIVIAAPVRKETTWHVPLGYCGSYLVGIAIAILMNVFPHPNRASSKMHILLQQYGSDLAQCRIELEAYTTSAGQSSPAARAAIAGIDLLVERLDAATHELQSALPHVIEELNWWRSSNQVQISNLEGWVAQLKKQTSNFQMLRIALKQRFLGEGIASHDKYAREIRRIIATKMETTYIPMLDIYVNTILQLNDLADPERTSSQDTALNVSELSYLLEQNQEAFSIAVRESTLLVVKSGQYSKPQLAHLARRMTSFHSIFAAVKDLIIYVETSQHPDGGSDAVHPSAANVGATSTTFQGSNRWQCPTGCIRQLCTLKTLVQAWLESKWLWHDALNRRLALKTAVGMAIASLFVSLDILWDVSSPFGFWPGLTVASVNLANMGSSFHKAADRLFGTLLAAAYAMLVADIFPPENDAITIASIGVFTFGVIYLRNPEHAYTYTYAATSIGSMSYGSVQNDVGVDGYVPKRIQLIFVGVFLFAFVELMLFPRSSQELLERNIMGFFGNLESYLESAKGYVMQLEQFVLESQTDIERPVMDDDESGSFSERIILAPSGVKLKGNLDKVKASAANLRKEVFPALKEPYFGFSHRLRPEPMLNFVKAAAAIDVQSSSLMRALVRLCNYYQMQHQSIDDSDLNSPRGSVDIRQYDWPGVYANLLRKASTQIQICCDNLRIAYPDGRVRPQQRNSLEAVASAASFRDLDSVRLDLMSLWSDHFMEMEGHDARDDSSEVTSLSPNQVMTLGIAISFLLEICRHVQKAGKHLEEYARTFPTESGRGI